MDGEDRTGTLVKEEPEARDGFVMVLNSWLDRDDVSPEAKFLYIVLKRFAGANRHAWPAESEITRMTGISDKPLRRAKAELIQLGVLTSQRRGQGKPTLYTILEMPKLPQNRSIDRIKNGRLTPSRPVESPVLEREIDATKKIQREDTEKNTQPDPAPNGAVATEKKPNKFAEVIDGIRALGEEYQGNTRRDAGAVKACSSPPADIAQAYVDAKRGQWGGDFLANNLALWAICDRMSAWQASKSRGKNGATIGPDGKLTMIDGKVVDRNGRIYF
jgi:hypothetical protein